MTQDRLSMALYNGVGASFMTPCERIDGLPGRHEWGLV